MKPDKNIREFEKHCAALGLTVEPCRSSLVYVYDHGRRVARYNMAHPQMAVPGAVKELRKLGYRL